MKLFKTSIVMLALVLICLFLPKAQAVEFLFERDAEVPLVYVSVSIKSGYVNDPPQKLGLTNFLGDVSIRGTKTKTKEQIDSALDHMGADLYAVINPETIIYRGGVLKSELPQFLNLLSEVLTQPSFSEAEMKKLKLETISQIYEEMNRDSSLASRRFNQNLFGSHPYGRPPLGRVKDIEAITQRDLIDFHQKLLHPSNILVLATGDSNPEEFKPWLEDLDKKLTAISKSAKNRPAESVTAPALDTKSRVILIDKPDRTQTQIFLGHAGIKMTDPRYFALYVANYAFGGGSFQSRLMKEIRVKRGWSYGANSSFRYGLQPRSWHMYTFPASKDTPAAAKALLDMMKELAQNGITKEEFESAKRALVNSSGFMFNTAKKRVENRLTEKNLHLPDGFFRTYAENIQKLELSDVNAALKDFLRPNETLLTVLGTASVIKEPLAKELGIQADQIRVIPYQQE